MKKVIVDTFGADSGSETVIKGSLDAALSNPELALVLVGNKDEIEAVIYREYPSLCERTEIIDCDDYITNDEPATAILERNECSLCKSLKRLKTDDECIGFLSAGNTGALLVGTIFKLGLVKGLKTPALSSAIPTYNGNTVCLVDCGANIDCTPKDFAHFALMGDAFIRSIAPGKIPKVAILSVGKEKGKGTKLIKESYSLLSQLPINFVGLVEGSDLAQGEVDVIVADGFSGNVLLKSVESAGKAAIKLVENLSKNDTKNVDAYSKVCDELSKVFELNTRGGATFLGTEKAVIKMHGCAERETPKACIEQLLRLENAEFSLKVKETLEQYNT